MPEPFKNLFNPTLVAKLGEHLHRHYAAFAKDEFINSICQDLPALELKQRSARITAALQQYLPADFLKARDILLAVLHPDDRADLKAMKMDDHGVRGWAVMPMADFIAQCGLRYFDDAMDALAEMTKRFSAEFAVRPLINANPAAALKHIQRWAQSDNEHLRRLASEGARPRLPWGQHIPAFIENPAPMLPILQQLRDDPSDYVRRSVANHLNDIGKDHPELLARITQEWLVAAPIPRVRLLRHACRSLIKKGDATILQAFGFTEADVVRQNVVLERFQLGSPKVNIGDDLHFTLAIRSTHATAQTLVVDYVVHWRRANGGWSPKVFKWKNVELLPGQTLQLHKKHSLKKVTTRTYYAGAHKIAVQINGHLLETLPFELLE